MNHKPPRKIWSKTKLMISDKCFIFRARTRKKTINMNVGDVAVGERGGWLHCEKKNKVLLGLTLVRFENGLLHRREK